MSYQVGDLVWAKIRGYSPWPGLVSQPWPELRTSKKGPNNTFIYFFGSKNYGWSSASNLKPYHEFKDKLKEFSKKTNFKLAVEEIEEYIENVKKFKSSNQSMDSNNEIYNGTTNGITIQTDIDEESRESSVIQEQSIQPNEKAVDVSVTLPRVDIYDCKRCTRAYLSLVELEDHAIDSHMDTACVVLDRLADLCCSKCGSNFANSFEYNMHMLAHIRENVHNSYGKRKTNNNNKNCKTFEAKYQCEKCDARYVLESTLTAHLAVHEPAPYICKCGVGYYLKTDLTAHKKLVHPPTVKIEMKKYCPKIKQETISRCSSDDDNDESYTEKKRFKKSGPKVAGRKLSTINKMTDVEKQALEKVVKKGDKFLCPLCNKEICSKSNLVLHYRTHTGDKRHTCDVCGKSFVQEGALKLHVKRHMGVKDNFCKYCNKGFLGTGGLALHERTHTGEKPYECKYKHCGKRFADPSAFIRHLRIHTDDKRYACDQCHKAFTDSSALYYHKKRHANNRKHVCSTCGKRFYIKYYLDLHVQRMHLPREKKYSCEYCLKTFYESLHLKKHVMNMHTKENEFHCDHCGRVYHCKPTLVLHIRNRHTIIYYCDNCKSKFYSESHFMRHKFEGCTRKVFVCEICDKELLSKVSYVCHINAHASLARTLPECHHCGMKTNEKKSLVSHIFTKHLGYPYQCSGCSKKFVNRCDYKKHTCIKKHYTCNVCGEKFHKKDRYVVHRDRHKDPLKSYRCHCCDKQFSAKSWLRLHILRQMREKMPRCTPCHKLYHDTYDEKMGNNKNDCKALEEKFQCELCDAKYLLENTLIAHYDVHDCTPHACECGAECPTMKDLITHKRSHHPSTIKTMAKRLKQKTQQVTISRSSSSKNYKSNTKTKTFQKSSAIVDFKKRRAETKTTAVKKELRENLAGNNNKVVCHVCNKEISKKNFAIHYRIHTGDKRHSCKVCGKSFVQKIVLDLHIKKHSGVKE